MYRNIVSPFSVLTYKGLEADHFVLVGALACFDQNCSFCVTPLTCGSSLFVC